MIFETCPWKQHELLYHNVCGERIIFWKSVTNLRSLVFHSISIFPPLPVRHEVVCSRLPGGAKFSSEGDMGSTVALRVNFGLDTHCNQESQKKTSPILQISSVTTPKSHEHYGFSMFKACENLRANISCWDGQALLGQKNWKVSMEVDRLNSADNFSVTSRWNTIRWQPFGLIDNRTRQS